MGCIMENQLEKKMENEMETGIIMGHIGSYWVLLNRSLVQGIRVQG